MKKNKQMAPELKIELFKMPEQKLPDVPELEEENSLPEELYQMEISPSGDCGCW